MSALKSFPILRDTLIEMKNDVTNGLGDEEFISQVEELFRESKDQEILPKQLKLCEDVLSAMSLENRKDFAYADDDFLYDFTKNQTLMGYTKDEREILVHLFNDVFEIL